MRHKEQKKMPYRFTCPFPVEVIGYREATKEELRLIAKEEEKERLEEERKRKEKKQNNN